MPSLRRLLGPLEDRLLHRSEHFQVLSLNVQARQAQPERIQSQFEVLVRHVFDRLLNNEAFGEDAALRVTQLAYAIALPGALVALFLFPAYHGFPPHPEERSYWAQAADHLFYVTYSFAILGTAMVFQWDLLFPDLLDVYVLSSLPIARTRLLLGRVTALGIFLLLVLVGTTGLGDLFLPGVADLRCGFWRHFAAHTAAATMSGVFAALLFVALQGLLVCLPGRRLHLRLAPALKTLSVVLLLTTLCLFPLLAHYLPDLLESRSAIVAWFPPFWYLGVYEVLLDGASARPIFYDLAGSGLLAIAGAAAIAALTYPVAYRRQVRQQVEGIPLQANHPRVGALSRRLLHLVFVRTPQARAIFHFAAQTLLRLPRLHLYLAMYAGLGFALVISGLVILRIDGDHVRLAISSNGVRLAVPVLAFWAVAGLHTALRAPLGRQGRWVFRVIHGRPQAEELHGAETLVRTIATLLTVGLVIGLHLVGPAGTRVSAFTWGQVIVAVGLCVVLTDLFFLTMRTIPFTSARLNATRDLPIILVRYLVVFPAFALTTVSLEPWIEGSALHLLLTALGFAAAHGVLARVRHLVLQRQIQENEPIFTELGLRTD